jgi:DNA-binding beta-propeller fold protein YncE
MWPKPLPNKWVMGSVIGVAVDPANDNVWMIHRLSTISDNEKAAALNPPISECCYPAPPVLAFDQAGDLIKSWGGPGTGPWPDGEHGIFIDHLGNVWTGGNGPKDNQIMKFTQDGKFLQMIGTPGKSTGSNDTENMRFPPNMFVDPTNNEIYVADGYGNRRVIVFDAASGKYKRHWGAYGSRPDDEDTYNAGRGQVGKDYDPNKVAKQFSRTVHGVEVSNDGLVYVNDRINNRFQVFKKDGTFVAEQFINKNARWYGSSFEMAFSPDKEQRFLYNADGVDQRINILDRKTLRIIGGFGTGGRYPGQFYAVHSIASDSRGNIYTGETNEGKRLQRFVYKGLGPATAMK